MEEDKKNRMNLILKEKEKKRKRNEYMRKYYLKRHYNIVDGKYVKYKPRKPKQNTFSIVKKEITISFD
jgi:hypothetical protein